MLQRCYENGLHWRIGNKKKKKLYGRMLNERNIKMMMMMTRKMTQSIVSISLRKMDYIMYKSTKPD